MDGGVVRAEDKKNAPTEHLKFKRGGPEMKRRSDTSGAPLKTLFYLWMALCVFVLALAVPVQAEIVPADPMVRITSLPLGLNVKEIMTKLSDDVSRDTGLNKNMITYYWQTFDAVYCPGCKGAPKTLVIFVDLYVPGSFTDKQIAGLMTSLAASLEKHTGIAKEWVFIHTHFPKEGHVFITGKVATWEEIKALDQKAPSPKKTSDNQDPGKGAGTDHWGEQKTTYDAHRSYVKLHFADQEMEFAFQWILGSTANGGCEIGEAFYVAGQIKDGNPQSWQEEWEKMAKRVAARAEQSLAAGHRVSARGAFLKAANYYRAALISMLPDNPKFKGLAEKLRACFRKAGTLFEPPLEYLEIPFEGTVLPGYFRKGGAGGRPRPTLVMIGGGETFAEDNWFYIGPEAGKRGYNFLTVDLPGQGLLPLEKHFFRADMEVPLKAVLDYAYRRPEIDPTRLAAFGISNGGYFVPRAAVSDKRLKACVVSAAVVDNYRMFAGMSFAQATKAEINRWPAFKRSVASAVAWRWGLDPADIKGQVEKGRNYQFDPSKVACPALSLVSAGDYANAETQKQQQEFIKALPNPRKKLVITRANEGASAHCLAENRSLMSQIVFDWLDELFQAALPQ
jgi:alpha-beta hydrolase superfamily lysophospholipase